MLRAEVTQPLPRPEEAGKGSRVDGALVVVVRKRKAALQATVRRLHKRLSGYRGRRPHEVDGIAPATPPLLTLLESKPEHEVADRPSRAEVGIRKMLRYGQDTTRSEDAADLREYQRSIVHLAQHRDEEDEINAQISQRQSLTHGGDQCDRHMREDGNLSTGPRQHEVLWVDEHDLPTLKLHGDPCGDHARPRAEVEDPTAGLEAETLEQAIESEQAPS